MINCAILADALSLIDLDRHGNCPNCGEFVDTGIGFGHRDYECSNCDFSASFPIDWYRTILSFL